MISRRAVLAPLALGAAGLSLRTRSSAAIQEPVPTSAGLGELAAAHQRLYGCAATTSQLADPQFAPVLAREAKILVAEYEMKRAALEPQSGMRTFDHANLLLQFARSHGLAFRGHTLVWHRANPAWLEEALSTPPKETLITEYVSTVAGRYRGQMHSWDVVNEAILPGNRSDHLRDSPWLRAFGPAYIDLAFHAAREADPKALLVYNDWGCEAGGRDNDLFRAATLDFLERAKARNVPIDTYGMQGHLQAFGRAVDQRKLRDFLDTLEGMGLRILITEHDVDDSGGPLDKVARDRAVADASRRFLDVVLDNRATAAVLTWGLSDRFLDPPGLRAALRGYRPRTLPLDADFVRKPLWNAMAAGFRATQTNS